MDVYKYTHVDAYSFIFMTPYKISMIIFWIIQPRTLEQSTVIQLNCPTSSPPACEMGITLPFPEKCENEVRWHI